MKLDSSALLEIAQRVKESRKILERTHQRISQSLESLITLQDTVAKASHILGDANARPNHQVPSLGNRFGKPL